MVETNPQTIHTEIDATSPKITRFFVSGLFGTLSDPIEIGFPPQAASGTEPSLLILVGRNGSGKTTVLNMIAGMLELDFDVFRRLPFEHAYLDFSTGDRLEVFSTGSEPFPLRVKFRDHEAELSKDKQTYNEQQRQKVNIFRSVARRITTAIHCDLLDIHRSLALKNVGRTDEDVSVNRYYTEMRARGMTIRPTERENSLSQRVLSFTREAQVNYRRYFSAEELELLPRILQRLSAIGKGGTPKEELLGRVNAIKERFAEMKRLGLQTDDADLKTLSEILSASDIHTENSMAVLEAYVEMQESRNKARELIAKRLLEFEAIMSDFIIGKTIRVDARRGLRIITKNGALDETELSSGEYHFLYMMVSALLCFRSGSIIAIDEPELSLHVTWQRKLIRALTKCASGAAPLFLFATHSSAISAEHREAVTFLGSEE